MADVQRTRSRSNPTNKSKYTHRKTSRTTGALISETYGYPDALGPTESITDFTHPGFAKRRAAGELIFGPLSITRTRKSTSPGSLVFTDVNTVNDLNGALFSTYRNGTNPVLSTLLSSTISACQANCAISTLKKLNEAETDFGEVLGTLSSTVSMLSRPFSGMQALLLRMEKKRAKKFQGRKGSLPSAGDYAKATADTWLEQSFGWRPLFGDMFTCLGLYEKKAEQAELKWRFARGGAKAGDSSTSSATGTATGGIFVGMVTDATWVREVTYVSSGGVVYMVPMGFEDGFYGRHLGLGVNNLPSSGWNLIPYSWIVDQVIGVGDWIKAATPSPGIRILASWRTDVRNDITTGSSTLKIKRTPSGGVSTWYYGSGGSMTDYVTTINRQLSLSLPSTPQFNPYLGNLAQILNNVAFGSQVIGSLLKRWAH